MDQRCSQALAVFVPLEKARSRGVVGNPWQVSNGRSDGRLAVAIAAQERQASRPSYDLLSVGGPRWRERGTFSTSTSGPVSSRC